MSDALPAAPQFAPPAAPSARLVWLRWGLFALFILALAAAYIFLPLKDWILAIAADLRALGLWGIALYTAAYIGASLLFFPAALLSISAGVAWGTWGGLAVAVPASTLAASVAFGIARHGFSGRFRRALLSRPRLSAVEVAVSERGPALVFLLRLSPIMPFPALNYIFGLAFIRYRAFAAATAPGMVPITLMWTYVGELGAELAGPQAADVGLLKIGVGVVGALITLVVTVWVGRAARRALAEAAAHDQARRASQASQIPL